VNKIFKESYNHEESTQVMLLYLNINNEVTITLILLEDTTHSHH